MPSLPVRLAATSERWLGEPAVVTETDELSPGLRRVVFRTPALAGKPWRVCLAGNVEAVGELRTDLRAAGPGRVAVATKAHWRTRRRGL